MGRRSWMPKDGREEFFSLLRGEVKGRPLLYVSLLIFVPPFLPNKG